MKMLVAVATKHGATREIAEAIGTVLVERGVEVDLRDAVDAPPPDGYDAVVLGSAVYMGKWLAPARDYVERHAESLAARQVWLFSSGPIGDPPRPEPDDAVDVAAIVDAAEPVEHRVFSGRLDRSRLGFGERAVVTAFRAPDGDARDWGEIAAWAAGIANAVSAEPSATR